MLKLYERLTTLVEKLPGGLQKPILKELVPLREIFLEQRPARLCLLGGASPITVPALLHEWCHRPVETGESRSGWREYRVPQLGSVEVLDARQDTPQALFDAAVAHQKPDLIVFLRGGRDEGPDFQEAVSLAAVRTAACDSDGAARPAMVALAYGGRDGTDAAGRLRALLYSHKEFVQRGVNVFTASSANVQPIVTALWHALPNPARLDFARMTAARDAQVEIASSLLTSFTALCGVIGIQPIPLADMPILTTIQTLMVGLVVYVSGRTASPRVIAEFVGALGVNIGAGFAFREGARALLKVFPIWGNAISGFVAGAGTYAIGRSAIAYFIEETPITETRKLFRKLSPGLAAFAKKGLPALHRETHSS